MELPSTESLQKAQQDLEEKINAYYSYKKKSAVVRSIVILGGTVGVASFLGYLTDSVIPGCALGALSGVFLLGPNYISIHDCNRDYHRRRLSGDLVNIEPQRVRITGLNPLLEYCPTRLRQEPQQYLQEQLKALHQNHEEYQKGLEKMQRIVSSLLANETDLQRIGQFLSPELKGLGLAWARLNLGMKYWKQGKSVRSELHETTLFGERIMASNEVICRALDYGSEFFYQARSDYSTKGYVQEIDECISLTQKLSGTFKEYTLRSQKVAEATRGFRSWLYQENSASN